MTQRVFSEIAILADATLKSEMAAQCGKFQDFSVIQILREIKFGDSRNAKSAILTHLELLDFVFHEFLHFVKAELPNQQSSELLKLPILAFLDLLDSRKLISHKI